MEWREQKDLRLGLCGRITLIIDLLDAREMYRILKAQVTELCEFKKWVDKRTNENIF